MLISLSLLVFVASTGRTVLGACTPPAKQLPAHFFSPTAPTYLNNSLANPYTFVDTEGAYSLYGIGHKKITVTINGVIVFGHYRPASYPRAWQHYRDNMVAAFWASADIRRCGKVSWEETTVTSQKQRFRDILQNTFNVNFTPRFVFIVTYDNIDESYSPCCSASSNAKRAAVDGPDFYPWENLGQSERSADDAKRGELGDRAQRAVSHGLNSYQIVLGTDGATTYAVLNYAAIGWTDSPYSMAGFWTNYDAQMYMHRKSFTADLSQIANNGTKVTGQYVFRISGLSEFIKDPDTTPNFVNWP